MNDLLDDVALINGIKMRTLNDMVVRASDDAGNFEKETFAFWKKCTRPGFAVIDVGAYTGLYAIHSALQGLSVHAFEPNRAVFDRLKENCLINKASVNCYNVALSDASGHKSFKQKNMALTSAGTISTDGDSTVVAHCLDSYFGKSSKIQAIKIDVEGHECHVLRGAAASIQKNKPLVIAEFNSDDDQHAIIKIMHEFGYSKPIVADQRNLVFKP